jgi:hypothetical protein
MIRARGAVRAVGPADGFSMGSRQHQPRGWAWGLRQATASDTGRPFLALTLHSRSYKSAAE